MKKVCFICFVVSFSSAHESQHLYVLDLGIVLGSRNALGDRVCHWEEVVHAATLPKAVSATRKKPKVQRVPKIWQLVVQEQKANFTVPDQRYDFTDLFAGSLKEAAQTIETGTRDLVLQPCTEMSYSQDALATRSRPDSRQRCLRTVRF